MSTKKILPLSADLHPAAKEICDAMAKKFVDPAGNPHFQFKLEDGHICAEGDAWGKKASERPAMGTMASFAEGYVQCLLDR